MVKFFEYLVENASMKELIAIALGGLVIGALFIFAVARCVKIERNSDVKSHSIVKIILIAIGPIAVSVFAFLGLEAPTKIGLIASVICAVGVTIWNIVSMGFLRGLLFSVVHIVVGFLAGMSIVAVACVVLFIGIISLFGGLSGGLGGSSSSGSVPEYVRNLNTGESYYVTERNGVLWLDECGVIIRPSDYSGRFIDDNRNEYIAC